VTASTGDARINRWEVYHARDGWRVRLVAGENGQVLLSGEAYADRRDAEALVDRARFVHRNEVHLIDNPPAAELNDAVGVADDFDEDESTAGDGVWPVYDR
jgi:uncharacterized protein YegP (UPF0339 family)